MNLALFYEWADPRNWAHWNRSFDVHLSCLRPGRWFSASSGRTADGLVATTLFVYWNGIPCPWPAGCRAVALKPQSVSESLRNMDKTICWSVAPEFLIQLIWNEALEFAFLISPRDANSIDLGQHFENLPPLSVGDKLTCLQHPEKVSLGADCWPGSIQVFQYKSEYQFFKKALAF